MNENDKGIRQLQGSVERALLDDAKAVDEAARLEGRKQIRELLKDERRPWYKRHHDDEIIDEIRIVTVPRFKTSELSGDEWRTSARIEFRRKDKVIHTELFTAVKYAVNFLPYLFVTCQEDGDFDAAHNDRDRCCQPGCCNKATVEYRARHQYCDHCGEIRDMSGIEVRRKFCDEHRVRGDCGLEDADDNYEVVDDE